MTLQLLLVDDEPLARARLRTLLAECRMPAAAVAGEAGNAAQAMDELARRRFDAVLLDVHMPGVDGLSLARTLRGMRERPAVVFVTAHPAYAVSAFEIDAVDYLTKPVRQERLQAALQNTWTVLGLAGVFVVLAFSMFGFFELQLPAFVACGARHEQCRETLQHASAAIAREVATAEAAGYKLDEILAALSPQVEAATETPIADEQTEESVAVPVPSSSNEPVAESDEVDSSTPEGQPGANLLANPNDEAL